MVTRPPAVAGAFYPGDPERLVTLVEGLLTGARQRRVAGAPKAVIAPHAGYVYSGPIAGTAYSCLREGRPAVERVVLVGPSHRVRFTGVAASPAEAFATPLGNVAVDRETVRTLVERGLAVEHDGAHAREHSLEVHLPFLQRLYPGARVVPLLVGDDDFAAVEAVLEALWGGDETAIVVSSDLSHYHDCETARRMDAETAAIIEALAAGEVDWDRACGATPVNALLDAAKKHGLHAATVDLRNSGDTAGPRSEVVGYGAFVFTP